MKVLRMEEHKCEFCGRAVFKLLSGSWVTWSCASCGYKKTENVN